MLYTAAEIVVWITAAFVLGFLVAWAIGRVRSRRPRSGDARSRAAVDPAASDAPPVHPAPGAPRALQRQILRLHEEQVAKDATIERLTIELEQSTRGLSDGTLTRLLDELAARREAEQVKDRAIAQLAGDLAAANDMSHEHRARRIEAETIAAALRRDVIDLEVALADLHDDLTALRATQSPDDSELAEPS